MKERDYYYIRATNLEREYEAVKKELESTKLELND